jgi:hypothetical protein
LGVWGFEGLGLNSKPKLKTQRNLIQKF